MTQLTQAQMNRYEKLYKDSNEKHVKYLDAKKQDNSSNLENLKIAWLVAFTKLDKWCEKHL